MSSTTQIRNAIVAALQDVEGIGRVHAFERYAKDTGKLAQLYMVGRELHGWYVRRVALREVEWSSDENREVATWRIVGFMALKDEDASELAFDLIIDRIRAAFRNDESLGGLVEQLGDPDGGQGRGESAVQIEGSGPVMFCGVLCHQARLLLTTVAQRPIGEPVVDDLALVHVAWDFAEPSTAQSPDGQIDAETVINYIASEGEP